MPTREELEGEFRELGIDFVNPGFCDTPAFQQAERQLAHLRMIRGADPESHAGRRANRELHDIAHFVVLRDSDRVGPTIVTWPHRMHHRALPGNVLDRVKRSQKFEPFR